MAGVYFAAATRVPVTVRIKGDGGDEPEPAARSDILIDTAGKTQSRRLPKMSLLYVLLAGLSRLR